MHILWSLPWSLFCIGDCAGFTISGTVYVDADGNKAKSAGEVALAGIQVSLLSAAGDEVEAEAISNAFGAFSFNSVQPGSHRLRFLATGYMATTPGDMKVTVAAAHISGLSRGFVRGGVQV